MGESEGSPFASALAYTRYSRLARPLPRPARGKLSRQHRGAYSDGVLTRLVQGETRNVKADGLFPQLNHRTSARPTVPVEIRLPARAAATHDQLVQETAAESCTQLIVAALRQHLT